MRSAVTHRPLRRSAPTVAVDLRPASVETARAAGLRHVHDGTAGIARRKHGKGFRYTAPDGKPVRDTETLARIRSLAIPPAWTKVWICPLANGHIQATGRDAKGRKQYRYHPAWRAERDDTKFDRMLAFGEALPTLRAHLDSELRRPGLPREKVLATIVRLLELTLIRVGNEEYAQQNNSYGLTTLRNRHVKVEGSAIRFGFRGKSGVKHAIDVRDKRLAKIVRQCKDLPGYTLFTYLDDDAAPRAVDSSDVNSFLQTLTGQPFTAKDFRTWSGTILAALALRDQGAFASETEGRKKVNEAITLVAARLGNTRAVCRKSYVHPGVIACYLDGTLGPGLAKTAPTLAGLTDEERAVMGFLRRLSEATGR